MKKAILLVILFAVLMTGCDDDSEDFEIISQLETTESVTTSGEVSCEITETCSDTMPPKVPETICIQEITEFLEFQEIIEIITDDTEIQQELEMHEEIQEPEIVEIPEKIATEPNEPQPETEVTTMEELPEYVIESTTETEIIPEIVETVESPESTEIPETEPETESEQEVTDLEKAQNVYAYMLENGHGTCVNYACQTYEKCLEIGLSCYIVWTDAGIYGHVANTVCVNGIWFIFDAQAECFLEFNYGFTEVVNEDGEHIADGEMLSKYSYQEVFG